MYYEWDGKEESATGVKPEKKETSAPAASAPASKPAPTAAKKSSPFSNTTSDKPSPKKGGDDEPPF